MRWRNEQEKRLVLEAAAEYGERQATLMFAAVGGAQCVGEWADEGKHVCPFDWQHFEQWLTWWLHERFQQQLVPQQLLETYTYTADRKPNNRAIPQASEASAARATPPAERTAPPNWTDLLAALKNIELTDEQYSAVKLAASEGRWHLREHEPLLSMVSKINKAALQQKLVDAWQEAG